MLASVPGNLIKYLVASRVVSGLAGKKKAMLDTMSKVVGLLNDVAGLGTAVARGLGPMIGS